MLDQITPLILTYNEAPNISRTLQQLSWANRILVIDSFSNDRTIDILKTYPNVDVIQRKFISFADQCNFGLAHIKTSWVLSLDADYVLSADLCTGLQEMDEDPNINSYQAAFRYCVEGQPLRGTLLPPRRVLYRRSIATYIDDGHAHRVVVPGVSKQLSGHIYHDDRKPLSRWLLAQDRYMVLEVKKFSETPLSALSWGDRIRQLKVIAPFIIFFYCLILKGGILDGWRGWYYAFQRMLAELLLSIRLIEAELQHMSNDGI